MWFENAHYTEFPTIPTKVIKIGTTDKYMQIDAYIQDDIYAPLCDEETSILEQSGFKPETEIKLILKHKTIKKERYSDLVFIPVRINSSNNNYEKLISCTVGIIVSFSDSDYEEDIVSKSQKTTQSVLASGKFYKISATQPGIYRLTSQNLTAMGIDVSAINPKNARIYGNGGQMLPEANSESRIDDLFENSIYVYGEDDGSFDANDYILFYAAGPHSWKFDTVLNEYKHTVNIYNDKSYYFITFDKGPGKRIQEYDFLSQTPSITTNIFLDKAFHENNLYNLIKSGKQWYGELFDLNLNQSFSFSFPNFLSDSSSVFRIHMAARATSFTSAKITIGSFSDYILFSAISGGSTSDFAKPASEVMRVNLSHSNATVNISYDKKGISDAKAWLRNITVNTWRKLVMHGNQMHFQNPYINDAGNYVKYNIQITNPIIVWDITTPLEPSVARGNYSGGLFYFITEAQNNKEFIAHTGFSYYTPSFEYVVANQNLHSLPQKDYIIVAHPLFVEQANRLKNFHENNSGLSCIVVTPQQIYNEFSSGSQDISAIRDFVKMFYDRATDFDELPEYLLLFGRASYDYKNRISENTNFVPVFQTFESLSPVKSYSSDDFFGLLDFSEGYNCNGNLDISIGRFPVSTKQQAEDAVNKIFRYHEKTNLYSFQQACNFIKLVPNLADWRNIVTFISDDEDNNLHFNQIEQLSDSLAERYKHLNIDKIHLDAYPQTSTPAGERAPAVNEAINRRVQLGALIINFAGHGGELGWTHERILEISDINSWENLYSMPLFITGTCEFSRFDDPDRVAAGEMVFTNPKGGGIALYTTTRLAFSNQNFNFNRSIYKTAFEKTNDIYPTIGEIFSFAKVDNNSAEGLRNFTLFGDPAMRLVYPENIVITTHINEQQAGINPDTISAYDFVTIKGHIENITGDTLKDFNGIISPIVFDKPSKLITLATNPQSYPSVFYLQKNIIYKGKANVTDGEFSFSFYVPKDINYAYGLGKISYYAENGETDATGYFNKFYIGGSSDNIVYDYTGPEIRLFLNDTTFVNGNTTDENPILIALLSDSSGINTTGISIGHDIIAVLDYSNDIIVLNDYYESDLNSYTSGKVVYPFYNLKEGFHSLYLKAWDIFNNSSDAILTFYVVSSAKSIINNLFNYPNPFSDYTDFLFEHNQSCSPYNIKIDIYNSFGVHVAQIQAEQETLGYKSDPLRWYARTDTGASLPAGIYVYTLTLTSCENIIAKKTSKLIILK